MRSHETPCQEDSTSNYIFIPFCAASFEINSAACSFHVAFLIINYAAPTTLFFKLHCWMSLGSYLFICPLPKGERQRILHNESSKQFSLPSALADGSG